MKIMILILDLKAPGRNAAWTKAADSGRLDDSV